MNIEHRSDGDYIITGETTVKGESIVVKLNSEVDSQLIVYKTQDMTTNINLSWLLNYNEELGIYIELLAVNRLKTNKAIAQIDNETCVNELVNMIKNNGTLEDCGSIQKAIYDSYNTLFESYLENERILHSNIIVEGIVEVKDQNKVLGHGTRFIINGDQLIICEYAGKSIPINVLPQINIYKNDTMITLEPREHMYNVNNNSNDVSDISYLAYKINNDHALNYSYKTLEYPNLSVPYHYSDKHGMIQYIRKHNTPAEIVKYKIALKGKVEILNINKYMVNEFLI